VSGEPLRAGRIYVAPADHHLLVTPDRVVVAHGPKENNFRPSVDVLFRSAAYHYGSRAIGVVLSGMLSDGSSGLYAIRRLGGVAAVQDPEEALYGSMPVSALQRVDIDFALPAAEIGGMLQALVQQPVRAEPIDAADYRRDLKLDIDVASSDSAFERGLMTNAEPSRYTCPECHGVLFRIKEGKADRFRCHTGHGYSSAALLDELKENVETGLWTAVKSMQETCILLQEAAAQLRENGDDENSARMEAQASEIKERIDVVRNVALERAGLEDEAEERRSA
jgi:two-component system chemotaxis response regulator CheB